MMSHISPSLTAQALTTNSFTQMMIFKHLRCTKIVQQLNLICFSEKGLSELGLFTTYMPSRDISTGKKTYKFFLPIYIPFCFR